MNNLLTQVYSAKWENFTHAVKPIHDDETIDIKPANPLLLYIDNEDDFKSADIRLMIFGQETNSWYDKQGATIESVQNLYDGFFNEGECWSYGGQFWNGVNKFLSLLQAKYPGKKIRLVWNNIVKVGKQGDKGFPPDYIYEIERKHFSVINDELSILKPNVVVFLTGPNYDSVISDNFEKLKYTAVEPFTERELSKVELPNVEFAFRTYHPNYLWRNDIDWYFKTIVDRIAF